MYIENEEMFKWQIHKKLQDKVSHWESQGQKVN